VECDKLGFGWTSFCLLNYYATTAIQVIVNDRNCNSRYPIFPLVFFQSTAPKQYTLKADAYEHNNHVEQEDVWNVGTTWSND